MGSLHGLKINKRHGAFRSMYSSKHLMNFLRHELGFFGIGQIVDNPAISFCMSLGS